MNIKSERSRIAGNIKHYGFLKALGDISLRLLNRVVFFKVLKCIKIDQIHPDFLKCDNKFRSLFLPEDALRKLAKNPEYELPESFLDQALRNGDECYAFLDGDALASYGWYSNQPTESAWQGLVIHFSGEYIYMYKGLTHENYRGQRLHAIGMTRALEAYLAKGYKGIVSYVEWNNFGSLKSCYRMGYKDFGTVYAVRIFNRYFIHSDAGCQRHGFRLVPVGFPESEIAGDSSNREECSQLGNTGS